MVMKITENSTSKLGRSILIGMVVDNVVVGRLSTIWDGELFETSWENLIGSWCIRYYNKHQKAPKRNIENLAFAWEQKVRNKTQIKLVETFLSSISDEYTSLAKELNSNHVLDMADTYFKMVHTRKTIQAAQGLLDLGKEDEAEEKLLSFNKVQVGVGSGRDVFTDHEAVLSVFDKKQERSLINYDGALGEFFGNSLAREGFVAFMAPDKTGKTFWLLDLTYRAVSQRKRVGYIECGDMGEAGILKRFYVRAARHPYSSKDGEWPYTVNIPTSMKLDSEGKSIVKKDKKLTLEGPLTAKIAWEACQRFQKVKIKSKESYLRVSAHPNSTINVNGIESIFQTWEAEGWYPDVIVIDYADILAPPPGKMEARDQINTAWKQMRALSQKKHCLVITATQSDAAAYEANLITRSNFSEDKRKLAHVTGMIGINVSGEEKLQQVCRLNWIVRREAEFHSKKVVHVAGCLPIANPAILSTW